MQMICAWPKIWTLSGRLYIPCVPHKNNCKKKLVHTTWNRDSSIIIVRNVCVHPWLFIFSSRDHDRQSSEQNNRKLISLHNAMARTINMHTICRFLVAGNIFRLETSMNSLVKVPPYSKLNFQGEIFSTQNWCNITLKSGRSLIGLWEDRLNC